MKDICIKVLVPEVGLEPTNLAAHDFESCMFTNFITPAMVQSIDYFAFCVQSSIWQISQNSS